MSVYGKKQYWDERYSFKNESYEWYQSYDGFRHLLSPAKLCPADGVNTSRSRRTIEVRDRDGNIVPRSVVGPEEPPVAPTGFFPPRDQCRVLILGCGNSSLGEAMLRDGFRGGIVNVDFSDVVIDQMKQRYNDAFYEQLKNKSYKNITNRQVTSEAPVRSMEFVCADVTTELPFGDSSFDLIVCKGTLDAILSSAGSVASTKFLMHESCRLLRDTHGVMVVVTHGSPDNRLVFFENRGDEWWAGLNVYSIPKVIPIANHDAPKEDYVYICRKRIGGGKVTRPQRPRPTTKTIKASNSLVRSSSDEENDATIVNAQPIVNARPIAKVKMLVTKSNPRPTALSQVQIAVANH